MKIAIDVFVATMMLWLPAVDTFLTEIVKRIPQIPTSSKTVKYWAFGFAVLITGVWYYFTGDLKVDNVVQLAIHTVLNYGVAVGIYETFKKWIEKI